MSSRQARCIFGCDTFGVSMHGFPNKTKYPIIFEAWVSVIPENMAHENPEKVAKSSKVCDYHFKPEHRTRGHGITKTAIPCLYLKGVPKVITDLGTEHNYCLPRMKLAVSSANIEMATSSSSGVTRNTDSKSEKDTPSNHAALSDATLPNAESSGDHNIPEPSPPPQLNLHTAQMCRVCLALDVKMFDLRDTELKIMFQSITGIMFEENKSSKLGSLICWECAARLKAAATFRSKVLFSESLLQSLINSGEQIQKIKFETVKEQADDLAPKTLTVTEVFHIVDIEGQNNMTEESIMEEIKVENSEMDIAVDDNVAINTEIEDDSMCPNIEEENRSKILEGNPLHSSSSIEETINSGYSRPLQDIGHTSHQSDLTNSQEDFDDQIIKTFLESITKSKIVPKQNIQLLNPINRSKRAEIHDQPYYLKGVSEDGNKKKKLKTYGGYNKKVLVKERQERHTSSGAVANTVAEE